MAGMDNAHALVIGIANYQNINGLPATVLNDAQEVYTLLTDFNLCGYRPENVTLLRDQGATQAAIRQALAGLAARANVDSTVFFYISGHGGRVESGPQAGEYLLPADTVYTSGEAIARTAISGAEFTEALRAIPARKVLVAFDCCHSGGIGRPKDAMAPAIKAGFSESYYDTLKSGVGRVILASSRDDEYSWVLPGAANSLFTQQLLAGMRGGIASEDGLIRIFDLFEYLQPRVTSAQNNQHPIFKAELEENFPIALYLGGVKGVVPKDDQGFVYDAYISFADKEPDATWVWDTLLPELEQRNPNVRIAMSHDVDQVGVARVVNSERGIKMAKRTIVVLSENYFADNMAQFLDILGQSIGIQEASWRLMTVQFGPIDESLIPSRLSMLTTANLGVTGRRGEMEWSRLARQLGEPLPTGFR